MYRLTVLAEGQNTNLFNPANAVENWRIGGTGILNAVAGGKHTGFIPVVAGQKYTMSWANTVSDAPYYSFFAAVTDTDPISFVINSPATSPLTVTVPTGVSFIVVNLKHGTDATERTNFQIELGQTATTYKPWGSGDPISLIHTGDDILPSEPGALLELDFDPHNIFDENICLDLQLFELADTEELSSLRLKLKFFDKTTDDVLYTFIGTLADAIEINSLVAVMEASEEFAAIQLNVHGTVAQLKNLQFFNELDSLGRNTKTLTVPEGVKPNNVDVFQIITQLDNPPSTLYMQFDDDVELFTSLVRVANKLDARLWVELDPTITAEQSLTIASDLAPFNHRVRFLWSPVLARPANAVGLRGKKIPRITGGYVVAQHMLRDANVNSQGIPPLHEPIAGFGYPISFTGIEQRSDVVLNDPLRKKLADAQINVVQRIKYPNGIRFVIGDALTAYGDNNSLLKLTSSSDISMFIDNKIKQICFRHLLKPTESTIEDATKEIKRFLDACTSKERKLLVNSEELGGFYSLSLTPREDRPYDAINVKCGYRPHGTTRAIFLDTFVSK